MNIGITVIIPTLGRKTLPATIASIASQLNAEDAVVVVSEGSNQDVKNLVTHCANLYPHVDWTFTVAYGGCWGHPNRNYVLDNHVYTSHVWTLDDDDVATKNALSSLRAHMGDPWTIFKMTFGEGHFANGVTCWREQKIQAGDIGTPMLYAPISKARFGHAYMGDLDYANALQAELGEPIWAEDVVCLVRPVKVEED